MFVKSILRIIPISFVIWIVLSTIIPQTITKYHNNQIKSNSYTSSYFPYDSISNNTITDREIYFVIGHPDDEVMFFSPTILELSKPIYNNDIHMICFSKGDAEDKSMGAIRHQELMRSAQILGIDSSKVKVLDFTDGMDEEWPIFNINKSLKTVITEPKAVLITFDEQGVSNHPNHISLYHGVRHFAKENKNIMFKLKSLNFLEKYSSTLLTNIELFVNHFSKLIISQMLNININVSFFDPREQSFKFYSDLNMLSVSYSAMAYGHFSQMVWFRYGWLILSRYLTFNNIIKVT